jgi:hypothetical protein
MFASLRSKDYAECSFWMETSGDDLTPRPALKRSCDVDVAILGGDYSGLWTAYYLLQSDPTLRVAILEREIVGFHRGAMANDWLGKT